MRSFFFNAEPTTDFAAHPTGYDREYDANDHAAFFAPFFSAAGVMPVKDPNACKVVVKDAEEGNVLRVCAGHVYVDGRMCQFDGTETITVTEDCKIVARMNKSADVRAFQLLAVQELVHTEDIYDLELASVTITPVLGGYSATVTDTRTFLEYMGQPPYYPPQADNLPYILWLYTLGFPMDDVQRAEVEGNASLMDIFNGSLGAARSVTVTFEASDWVADTSGRGGYTLEIPRTDHGRQSDSFCYRIRHLSHGALRTNTWGVVGVDVTFDADTGAAILWAETAFAGDITFTG